MEFINVTPFPSIVFQTTGQHDQPFHVVVMRATLDIKEDNILVFAGEQQPLVTMDEFYDVANKSSVKQESDLAPYKPDCDVIVNATAYAPGGKPTTWFPAGIRIYDKLTPEEREASGRPWKGAHSLCRL